MKTVLTVAAVVLATTVAVSGWTAYLVRPATVHTVTHTRTVTVTVTSTPKRVIKWRTRAVSRPVGGVPCLEDNGHVWFAGGAGQGIVQTTCTITPLTPYASGLIQVTAADGTSGGTYAPTGG